MTLIIPTELRKFIGDNFEYYQYNFPSTDNISQIQKFASHCLLDVVRPYYQTRGTYVSTAVYNFLAEPLKNANVHGGREIEPVISLELFLSPIAFAAAFKDGGEYFKRQEIKMACELERKFLGKHKTQIRGIGAGAGQDVLEDLADFVYVDTDYGTLYLGMLVSNKFFKL